MDLLFTDIPGLADVGVHSPIYYSDHCFLNTADQLNLSAPNVLLQKIYLISRFKWNLVKAPHVVTRPPLLRCRGFSRFKKKFLKENHQNSVT